MLLFSCDSPFVDECLAYSWLLFGLFLMVSVLNCKNHKFSLKVVAFVILNAFVSFWSKILSGGGGNFQFLPNFCQFSQVHLKDEVISRH